MLPLLIALFLSPSFAQHEGHASTPSTETAEPSSCSSMMVFDRTSSSCIMLPMAAMPMSMWMLHGNAFAVQSLQPEPRGNNKLSFPNMLMATGGRSYGNNYFDVNLMLTAERWTFSKEGYPELLQIGERNEDDLPYIDAQHPHSSPIMGLTISDTMRLGEGNDYVRYFFAPRGQATEGPVAFMHRPTGMVNPDAPLGHHIGQDVSHISSTVLGLSLSLRKIQFEVSGFNGTEPEPTKSDLPTGPINSYAVRVAYDFSEQTYAMISAAEVTNPEPHDPSLEKVWRYSGSIYNKRNWDSGWMLHNTFIYGLVNNYDHISALRSLLYEFWATRMDQPDQYWGRVEAVERTGAQLAIAGPFNLSDPQWVYALTAGYTYKIKMSGELETGIGASITKDFLPQDFRGAYDGEPLSGKLFIQLSGMKMGKE